MVAVSTDVVSTWGPAIVKLKLSAQTKGETLVMKQLRKRDHHLAAIILLILLALQLGRSTAPASLAQQGPPIALSDVAPQLAQTNNVYLPMLAAVPTSFEATFDGTPSSPEPWQPSNWDVTVHSRDRGPESALDPMAAHHGSNCGAPTATHTVDSYAGAVFICRNHLMTAINGAAYGAIYLTPNALANFSKGETVIRFDMSTLRTSDRDWVDLWITPYEENLQFPLEEWLPDLQGEPRRAVHIRMYLTGPTNKLTTFTAAVVRDFNYEKLPAVADWLGYENVLTPDAARRDTFELHLSRTSIKFGLPKYNLWWVDTTFPDLGWDQGVVQFGHHSYNPSKCSGCTPNTWHWDNVSIMPARPFTIINGDIDVATGENPVLVQFPRSAPNSAHLRFAARGNQIEVSFNNGATWQQAQRQAQERTILDHASSFWTPIPAGTQTVLLREAGGNKGWHARDISIWAP